MAETPMRRMIAGRYEIRSLIGRGGMAEVHLAYDTRLSRMVAVKMLRLDLARDTLFQKRFRREAQSAASLNHPSIVAVYDTGEEPLTSSDGQQVQVPYIVMEYVEGHTVRELLSDGSPVPIDEAVEIVSGVLAALEYSHHRGLVHRDIKPGNVMLTNTGEVKVMDFGIARAMEDSQATMTQTDAVVGTAQYLSPEQARGETVDARSDLYSTGCLLFELLTGRPPFKGDSAVAVAYQHVSEIPPTPSSITPDIPDALDRVVTKSLAKRKEDRYSNALQMMNDLRAAVSGAGVSAPETQVWQTPITPRQGTQVMRQNPPAAVAPPATRQARAVAVERAAQKKRKRRQIFLIWTIVLLLLAAGSTAVALYMLNSPQPTKVETTKVPQNIVGMTEDEARKALSNANLNYVDGGVVYDDKIKAGRVVSTDPAAGTKLAVNSKVTVVLSKGKEQVVVPDLSGYSQDEAKQKLQNLGLQVGTIKTVDDPSVDKGNVVSTDPAKDKKVDKGTSINLNIASGLVTVPNNLVGKKVADVKAALSALHLSVVQQDVEDPTKDPGTVLSVSPSGYVEVGAQITIQVAKAPPAPAPDPNAQPCPDGQEMKDGKCQPKQPKNP